MSATNAPEEAHRDQVSSGAGSGPLIDQSPVEVHLPPKSTMAGAERKSHVLSSDSTGAVREHLTMDGPVHLYLEQGRFYSVTSNIFIHLEPGTVRWSYSPEGDMANAVVILPSTGACVAVTAFREGWFRLNVCHETPTSVTETSIRILAM